MFSKYRSYLKLFAIIGAVLLLFIQEGDVVLYDLAGELGVLDTSGEFDDSKVLTQSSKEGSLGVSYQNFSGISSSSQLEVYFCPQDDCFKAFNSTLALAQESIYCAVYELDEMNLSTILGDKFSSGIEIELIVDDRYLEEDSVKYLSQLGVPIFSDEKRGTRYNNYMHEKFCVIDENITITGSANPTERGLHGNNNNILVVNSPQFAAHHLREFEQLQFGIFGYNKEILSSFEDTTFLDQDNSTVFVDAYFCPQDSCGDKLLEILSLAQEEILFANFVLTHDGVEELLLEKSKEGVKVQGIVESRNRNSKGSRISELNETFPIEIDTFSFTMHHKYFVVDNKYVVTGSMNPSNSGTMYNDETLYVLENEHIVSQFRDDFFGMTHFVQ